MRKFLAKLFIRFALTCINISLLLRGTKFVEKRVVKTYDDLFQPRNESAGNISWYFYLYLYFTGESLPDRVEQAITTVIREHKIDVNRSGWWALSHQIEPILNETYDKTVEDSIGGNL